MIFKFNFSVFLHVFLHVITHTYMIYGDIVIYKSEYVEIEVELSQISFASKPGSITVGSQDKDGQGQRQQQQHHHHHQRQ